MSSIDVKSSWISRNFSCTRPGVSKTKLTIPIFKTKLVKPVTTSKLIISHSWTIKISNISRGLLRLHVGTNYWWLSPLSTRTPTRPKLFLSYFSLFSFNYHLGKYRKYKLLIFLFSLLSVSPSFIWSFSRSLNSPQSLRCTVSLVSSEDSFLNYLRPPP